MEDDHIINLTASAIIAAKEFMNDPSVQGDGLRVGIRGGGCSGFEYVLDFSMQLPNDFLMVFDGLRVYVDPVSAMHLEGTLIDYVSGLMGSGFKFTNPNATRTCGCGSSFSS